MNLLAKSILVSFVSAMLVLPALALAEDKPDMVKAKVEAVVKDKSAAHPVANAALTVDEQQRIIAAQVAGQILAGALSGNGQGAAAQAYDPSANLNNGFNVLANNILAFIQYKAPSP